MGSYVNAVLGKGERVEYQAQVALSSYWLALPFGGLCLLSATAMIVMASSGTSVEGALMGSKVYGLWAALAILPPLLTRQTSELVITNRRIIAKVGLLRRRSIEVNLEKIESIRVDQGPVARLMDYGNVHIIGTGGSQQPIRRIAAPLAFRRQFDEVLQRAGRGSDHSERVVHASA